MARSFSQSNINCIAKAVYHESRGESDKGRESVINVIKTRLVHAEFPKSACGVVYEKNQFSWTKREPAIHNKALYYKIEKEVINSIEKKSNLCTANSSFFSIKGFNNPRLKYDCKIGSHKFYSIKL